MLQASAGGRARAPGLEPVGAAPPPAPSTPSAAKKTDKEFHRRMPKHVVPPYVEANFKLMSFVMTRAPRLEDFPKERMYTKEGIDLLFRHYYKNSRA